MMETLSRRQLSGALLRCEQNSVFSFSATQVHSHRTANARTVPWISCRNPPSMYLRPGFRSKSIHIGCKTSAILKRSSGFQLPQKPTPHPSVGSSKAPSMLRRFGTSPTRDQTSRSFSVSLKHRTLLIISGRDAAQFLQGLTTNNIPFDPPPDLDSPNTTTALCAAFLNAQGRILQDVLIYTLSSSSKLLDGMNITQASDSAGPVYLLEVDGSQAASLIKLLRRYKLRSKVAIQEVNPEQLAVTFQSASIERDADNGLLTSLRDSKLPCFRDERAPGLGYRVIAPPSVLPDLDLAPAASNDDYRLHRYLQGVPEGQQEMPSEHALVHESNLDLMSGVDFRKGCYVGQELVIRTQHTGVVRKRIVPVRLYGADETPPLELLSGNNKRSFTLPYGADIKRVNDANTDERRIRSAGKWVANVGAVGLALARLEVMVGLGPTGDAVEGWQAPEFAAEVESEEASNLRIKAFVPAWWAQRKSHGDAATTTT